MRVYETGSTTDEIVNAAGCGLFQHFIFLWVLLNWLGIGCAFNVAEFVGWGAKCELGLSSTQQHWVSNIAFVAAIFGSLFWGVVADGVGRKVVGVVHMLMAFVGGFGAALSRGFWSIFICRFIVGFAIPGNLLLLPLLLEFSPVKWRGLGPPLVTFSWLFSSLYVAGAGWLVMDRGFCYVVLLTLLPLVMALAQACYIPESPHQLLVKGRRYGAEACLERISRYNGRGVIVPSNWSLRAVTPIARSRKKLASAWTGIKALFSPALRTGTLLILAVWLLMSVLCGALVVLTNEVYTVHKYGCEDNRVDLSNYDYLRMAIVTSAETVGIIISLLVIELIGRKWPMLGSFVLTAIGLFPMMIPMSIHKYAAPLFITRAGWAVTFILTMIYTTEFYPTEVRGIGIGMASCVSAIGLAVSRSVGESLVQASGSQIFSAILVVTALLGAIATVWLPKDEKGKELVDVIPSDDVTAPLLEPSPKESP